jgi:branched-chain amino acid transport system substrate-binding protein
MMLRRTASGVVAAALAVAAFSGVAAATDSEQETKGVVTIGVVAPLEGGLTSFGRGIRDSVRLAVRQANDAEVLPGWTIKVRAVDDSSDPARGMRAARKLVSDPSVVAVIGPYNSGVAEAILPTLADADLALVSPSNTLTSLTRGDDPDAPERPSPNYFRLVGPDSVQAVFLAEQARARGFSRAAVVSETKAVSKGLADQFAAAFADRGGTVLVRTTVPDGAGASAFTDFIASASASTPDVVFFGGEYEVAGTLRAAATKAGLTAPLLGGDGMNDPAYIAAAGAAADGTYASATGVPIDTLANGAEFRAAYAQAGFRSDPTNYGPYAYDATNTVLTALRAIAARATGTKQGAQKLPADARRSVVAAVQAADTAGLTGRIAFDEYGDTLDPQFTLYQVAGSPAAWVAQRPA